MKLKVEMCAKRDFIRKYINTDEEYIRAEIKDGGYAKFNIKVIEQTMLSRQDYFMRCSFIVETCLESYTFNKEMYYADGQIFLQELTASEGVTPASTAIHAYPIKEKKEEQKYWIYAIVPVDSYKVFEDLFGTFKISEHFNFNHCGYTLYEKCYDDNKDHFESDWRGYTNKEIKDPIILGKKYNGNTVYIRKCNKLFSGGGHSLGFDIVFVKESFLLAHEILMKMRNETTTTSDIDIHSSYPTKSMIKEEEEKRIHNIFAIVKINHCATFESHFTSFSSTSFNKITLAPVIESIYNYTVYEKDYMNEKELNNGWMIYSIHTEPLFINGHSYDTKTVVVEKNAIQEIIFVKDNFNIVMDILKDLKERAAIDINSWYPTVSMIKEIKEKEKMSTVMVDSKEYSETYRLANLYKKEHEVKNLLKNTGISIEFKPGIKDIKFNGPATIVFWNDGSKTVVKKGSGETTDDRKKAIIMAILKKNKEDYKIIENTFNSEDPELALAISLLKRNGYTKDMLNKIYNKYKPKEEVKPKRKTTTKSKKK